MLIKLLKDYGDHKTGSKFECEDEGGQQLIDAGIAEKYVPDITLSEIDEVIKANIKTQLDLISKSVEKKVPATPKDEDSEKDFLKQSPYKSAGQFFKAITVPDEKLTEFVLNYAKIQGMGEPINADGGFLIPTEFSTAILMAMSETGQLAPKARNFPVNNNLVLPFVNITSQATSWTGGVTIFKPGEGVAKTASKPAIGQADLKLHKMTALVYATDELIADSPIALQTFLTTMVSTEMALTKDEDMVNGSGAGEALGLMNSPCLVTIPKETSQPAATINYDNVLKMWMRIWNGSRPNAVWLINQDCMQQIAKLSLVVGTGGSGVFMLNATTNVPTTLMGRPIIWSPHSQTLGTTGDIILADFRQYLTITKAGGAGIDTATSIHVRFVNDETAFRFVVRFDGQPWWSQAVTPKHGTSTVSPFLTLATRS